MGSKRVARMLGPTNKKGKFSEYTYIDHRSIDETPITDHVAIQVKIGSRFLERIQRHATKHNFSRNAWIIEAIQRKLEGRKPTRIKLNASELMWNRKAIVVRIPRVTQKLMRQDCDEQELSTTVFIIDAAVIMLATYKKRKI